MPARGSPTSSWVPSSAWPRLTAALACHFPWRTGSLLPHPPCRRSINDSSSSRAPGTPRTFRQPGPADAAGPGQGRCQGGAGGAAHQPGHVGCAGADGGPAGQQQGEPVLIHLHACCRRGVADMLAGLWQWPLFRGRMLRAHPCASHKPSLPSTVSRTGGALHLRCHPQRCTQPAPSGAGEGPGCVCSSGSAVRAAAGQARARERVCSRGRLSSCNEHSWGRQRGTGAAHTDMDAVRRGNGLVVCQALLACGLTILVCACGGQVESKPHV